MNTNGRLKISDFEYSWTVLISNSLDPTIKGFIFHSRILLYDDQSAIKNDLNHFNWLIINEEIILKGYFDNKMCISPNRSHYLAFVLNS